LPFDEERKNELREKNEQFIFNFQFIFSSIFSSFLGGLKSEKMHCVRKMHSAFLVHF